jgi:hypothetical protein
LTRRRSTRRAVSWFEGNDCFEIEELQYKYVSGKRKHFQFENTVTPKEHPKFRGVAAGLNR